MNKALENQSKYLKAPTVEEIDEVLKHLGVTAAHFERFFNIYPNCIAQLHMGEKSNVNRDDKSYQRKLPKKYWHIIFENLPNKQTSSHVAKPKVYKPKIKRAKKKKVVVDEKILALL